MLHCWIHSWILVTTSILTCTDYFTSAQVGNNTDDLTSTKSEQSHMKRMLTHVNVRMSVSQPGSDYSDSVVCGIHHPLCPDFWRLFSDRGMLRNVDSELCGEFSWERARAAQASGVRPSPARQPASPGQWTLCVGALIVVTGPSIIDICDELTQA